MAEYTVESRHGEKFSAPSAQEAVAMAHYWECRHDLKWKIGDNPMFVPKNKEEE